MGATFYCIDSSDRILEVNADWDDFALANGGGPRSTRAVVIGQPLIDFVSGDAARMFVRAAIEAARLLGQSRVLPYRCDSPGERRRFDMVISPRPDGQVLVEHRLVSSEPRPRQANAATRASAGWRCSQCLSVRLAGTAEWISANASPEGLPAQDVCPTCAARLFELT